MYIWQLHRSVTILQIHGSVQTFIFGSLRGVKRKKLGKTEPRLQTMDVCIRVSVSVLEALHHYLDLLTYLFAFILKMPVGVGHLTLREKNNKQMREKYLEVKSLLLSTLCPSLPSASAPPPVL